MYINLVIEGKRTLGSISCITTTLCSLWPTPLNWVPLELLWDSDLLQETIAPHWSSSYPEYLSLSWDTETKQGVVWSRLWEHRNLASHKPSKQTERYHALHQEFQRTQVEPSHKPLSCDSIPWEHQQPVFWLVQVCLLLKADPTNPLLPT